MTLPFSKLSYDYQKKLYREGDHRVPPGWSPKPVGRPKGLPHTAATKEKIRDSILALADAREAAKSRGMK